MKKVLTSFILIASVFLLSAGLVLAGHGPIHFGSGWYTNLYGSTTGLFHTGPDCSTSSGSCTGPGADTVVRWECDGEQPNCQRENETWGSAQSLGDPGCGQTVQLDTFDHYCRDQAPDIPWSCGTERDYMVWYSGDCASPPPPAPSFRTISGSVTALSGGINGVSITIARGDGQTRSLSTDPSGNFSISDFIDTDDAYAVRAPAPPVTFGGIPYGTRSPSVNYENQAAGAGCGTNCTFIYSLQTYTIGGSITNSATGSGISGVTVNQGVITPPGCNIGTTATDANGNYRFSNIPYGLSFCLRPPAVSGYTGPNPASSEFQTATANKTDYNFTYTPSEVPTPLTVSCSGTPNPANSGQEVTWDARPGGGGGPGTYTYSWSGDASGTTNPVRQPYINTGTTAITKTATIQVTSGAESLSANCSVTITAAVQPNLTVDTLSTISVQVDNAVSPAATVRNNGTASTGVSSITRLKIDTNKDGTYDSLGTPGDKTTSTLSPSGTASFTWSSVWTPTATGTYNYQVCADATSVVTESDETTADNCKPSTITVTSTPPLPAAPTVSTSLSCIPPGYTGPGVTITYGSRTPPVTWANISSSSSFSSYYHKSVSGTTSTTAPNGFNLNPSIPPQPLTLNPDITYYVRVSDGTQNSQVRTFTTPPSCAAPVPTPAPTATPAPGPTCDGDNICEAGETTASCPTDCPPPGGPVPVIRPWIQTTGGDVHSNTGINTPGGP